MKILTLNTWQQCGPWQKRWEVILDGLDHHRPDIAAFQELFDADWARHVMKRGAYAHQVFPEAPSGLAILSRFPVRRWTQKVFKAKSPTENYFRYVLFSLFDINGHPVAVFNTHLSWKLDEGCVREEQVGELLDIIHEEAGDFETLLTGDFNATPESAEVRKILEEGSFTDTFASRFPRQAGLTWDNTNPYAAGSRHPLPDRRIDYVFVKRGRNILKEVKAVNVVYQAPNKAGVYASDHYGLLVHFDSERESSHAHQTGKNAG